VCPLADAKDLPDLALLADRLQLNFLMSNRIIPLAEQGDTLVVASADPFNREPIDGIGYLLSRRSSSASWPPARSSGR
jgi:general secretion pathway protein E